MTSLLDIRIFGDPVLKIPTADVTDIDGAVKSLCDRMLATMYEAPGIGLAANQIGIGKRLFVYDIGDGPVSLVNPRIVEGDGEWVYEEGCLSIPGLSVELVRPKTVHLVGLDLDGNEVSIEADELLARLFQHELDHLDGVTMFDRMDDDQRKLAMREWRRLQTAVDEVPEPKRSRLRLR